MGSYVNCERRISEPKTFILLSLSGSFSTGTVKEFIHISIENFYKWSTCQKKKGDKNLSWNIKTFGNGKLKQKWASVICSMSGCREFKMFRSNFSILVTVKQKKYSIILTFTKSNENGLEQRPKVWMKLHSLKVKKKKSFSFVTKNKLFD